MMENPGTGRAWIALDKAALRHNVDVISSQLPPGCALMPAVKANAYGHGAVLMAKELNELGIQAFCVATAQEGAELRENGITGEILVLGYTHPVQFPLLWQYNLTQTVLERSYAEALNASGRKTMVHIKIDTGMHRLGERWDHLEELAQIFDCKHLQITGAFTHLCTTSQQDRTFAQMQGNRFYSTIAALKERGKNIPKVHLLASGGLLHHANLGGDYARVGIALYGVLSTKEDMEACPTLPLQPILSLKARIAQVQEMRQGESAGYDGKFAPQRDSRIAVLPIGYADGLPRNLSCGIGHVLIHGYCAPIAGRICMDQTLVDVTEVPYVRPGDIAVLIGKSGSLKITAYDLAEQAGSITNEILSRFGTRLERQWM